MVLFEAFSHFPYVLCGFLADALIKIKMYPGLPGWLAGRQKSDRTGQWSNLTKYRFLAPLPGPAAWAI